MRLRHVLLFYLWLMTALVWTGRGFYIPGVAPREYRKGDDLGIKVRLNEGLLRLNE